VQAYRCLREPFVFLDECAARHGDAFTLRIAGRAPLVYVNSVELVKQLLAAPADTALAGKANEPLAFTFGRHSLILLDGQRHERQRRLLMPAFHGERMATYLEQIVRIADRAIDGARLGEGVAIDKVMETITLEVILECVFGIAPGPRQDQFRALLQTFVREGKVRPYQHLLSLLFADRFAFRELLVRDVAPLTDRLAAAAPLLRRIPIARLARCVRDLDRLIFADIAERRAAGTAERGDVMSLLLAARDDEGRPLDDEELRDQMITLLIAGHDTTATTLSFAISSLLAHPAILERARAELARVVGAAPLTPERLRELELLDAIVKEVLRLYGPAPGFARTLAKPLRLGDHDLPAGVTVTASTYLLHRDPRLWENPRQFDPTRFLERRVRPGEYVPFGGGRRTCLGMAFSLYETKAVLARWIGRTQLRPLLPRPELALRGLIYGLSSGVSAVLEQRV
jgi:cytochrome P450